VRCISFFRGACFIAVIIIYAPPEADGRILKKKNRSEKTPKYPEGGMLMNVSNAIFEPERGIPLFDISLCSPVP
jgi:hypothetical protein